MLPILTKEIFYTALLVLVGVINLIIVIFWSHKNNSEQKKSRKLFYWEFFIPQYLDGIFSFNNQTIELKDGRMKIDKDYDKLDEDGYKKFRIISKITDSYTGPTYENKFAHRLTVILNRIGQAAFAGDLPLDHIFSISSKMILKDWHMSKALIEKISGQDYSAVVYTRKYFRWLACASCMYMIANHVSQWNQAEEYIKQYVMDDMNFVKYIDGKKMKNEINILQKSDKKLLAKSTRCYMFRLKIKFYNKMKSLLSNQL